MLTVKEMADFVSVALLYSSCCCLCMVFWVWIGYMFSDPSEHMDAKTVGTRIAVLCAGATAMLLLFNMVQEF